MTEPGWERAPVGLLTLRADGTVLAANATVRAWHGEPLPDRFPDLLTVGGRIYWETHLAPLLLVERRVDEVALELRTPQGRAPVVLSAVVEPGTDGEDVVRVALAPASERVGYERELLRARQAAESAQARLVALQATTAALSRAVGVRAVADALLGAARTGLGGLSASLWLAGDDGSLRHDGPAPEPEQLPAVLPGTAARRAHDVLVPLPGPTGPQGVLSLVPDDHAGADRLDLELLAAVGQQAGVALDRARRHEQSAGVAHELQQSLLRVEAPQDERLTTAAAYRPGVEALEVGGDFYDVFLLSEARVALAVGDVVGRGLAAASAMGQLRSAVRAVAEPGLGPKALLDRLDRFVEQVEAASSSTLAYAELDLTTGELQHVCAGHPPPLLLPAVGPPRLLWDGRSTPLGTFGRPARRAAGREQLRPGDRLLLYTDGLVERRERSWDDGLALLADTAGRLRHLPPDVFVTALSDELLRDEQTRDDVCLLLVLWCGPQFVRQLDASLAQLSAVRRSLATWLRRRGADPAVEQDVVLATSEALANAAEHGSGGRRDAYVGVCARVAERPDGGSDVVVEVRDRGRWRGPVPGGDRGRGLAIARHVMDDVEVTTGADADADAAGDGDGDGGTVVVLRRRLRPAP